MERLARMVLVGLALHAGAGLSGCAPQAPGAGPSLDESTLALLSTARALHHEADVYESSGDFASASRAIQRVLALRAPAGVREIDDVRTDASGRLGELALRANDPRAAIERADEGLREARRESVLKARLFLVKGRALRALAELAQQSGDVAGASARRREAIDALEQSIQMNERVLRAALDGGLR
jgi:tetratricopeptide (TPR) repeat protein